jgi:putative transposase
MAGLVIVIAIGIGWDGRRQVLAIEVAHRESGPSWTSFLRGLKDRGLHGVEYVVSDDHDGLRKATWQEDARYLNMELLAEQKKEAL